MKNKQQYQKREPLVPNHFFTVLTIFMILLILTILLSFALGSRQTTLDELIDALFKQDAYSYGINVIRKRIPRTIFGLLCGASLGVSGALMQSVTRNPIAAPSVLGINSGAALFVVIGIAFFNIKSPAEYISLSLVGAFGTAVFVYAVGSMGRGGATPIKLVLAGSAISAALTCITTAIMMPRSYVMNVYRFWQVGSIGSGTWDYLKILIPFCVIGIVIAVCAAPALNALALGDEAASGLGVRVGVIRLAAALASVILCATVTALAGPIAFIGLMSPHLIRLILGADLRYTIPMSALAGAIILTISDVIGRLLTYPGELEVGIVTAFIGGPILIIATMRAKV